MRISTIFLVLTLASCTRVPERGFVVVDTWGTIVLRTEDKDEAWRLAEKLTLMGRVLASKPQYFVLKGSNRPSLGKHPEGGPEPRPY